MIQPYTLPGLACIFLLACQPAAAQTNCGCWIEPDSTWTNINPRPPGYMQSPLNAHGRHGPVALPFTFRFFGQAIRSLYVDKNGLLRLDGSTSAIPGNFPNPETMLAPFWARTDLYRFPLTNPLHPEDTINNVYIRTTPTAFMVAWSDVAYDRTNHGQLNSFQVIITDGTDPLVPDGNNVSYCYKRMEWATGQALSGANSTNGFDGLPATVGANKGDGVYYMQLGRFGLPDSTWGGSMQVSGIRWLNGRRVAFNTDIGNITPFFSMTECDTIQAAVGVEGRYEMIAHRGGPAPPLNAEAHSFSLSNFSFIDESMGEAHKVTALFTPTAGEVGVHTLQFQAYTGIGPVAVARRYVKVVSATGIEGLDQSAALSVVPNPASDHAVVRWTGAPPTELQLMDGRGRLLRTMHPKGDRATLATEGLAPGVYMLRSLAPGQTATVRLVVAAP